MSSRRPPARPPRSNHAPRSGSSGGRASRTGAPPARRGARSAARAASSAALTRPRAARRPVTGGVLLALFGKLLGLAVLLGTSGLLYDLASSPEFRIDRVTVVGNRLLSAPELQAVAAVDGLNVFWVRGSEIGQRLRRLPPIESARVTVELPDQLFIDVKEREPVAIWLAGETPFLVDQDGLVLAAGQPSAPLMTIKDTSNQPIAPGSRINADAVRSVARLDALLNQTFGQQPRQYEYAQDSGMNVVQSVGPRLILGGGENLDYKIASIQSIVRYLESNRRSAELIDVRFGDRPYFR